MDCTYNKVGGGWGERLTKTKEGDDGEERQSGLMGKKSLDGIFSYRTTTNRLQVVVVGVVIAFT